MTEPRRASRACTRRSGVGSSVRIPNPDGVELPAGFALETWVLPTLHVPEATLDRARRRPRAPAARRRARCCAWGTPRPPRTRVLRPHVWYRVVAAHDADGHDDDRGGAAQRARGRAARHDARRALEPWAGVARGDLVLGAGLNGKLDGAPRARRRRGRSRRGTSPATSAPPASPTSRASLHGETVQRPMRGATGPRLGRHGGRLAPGAGAVRRDPLPRRRPRRRRAGRSPSAGGSRRTRRAASTPRTCRRAARRTTSRSSSGRAPARRPRAIAVLLPTFSYLAYANEHLLAGEAGGDARGDRRLGDRLPQAAAGRLLAREPAAEHVRQAQRRLGRLLLVLPAAAHEHAPEVRAAAAARRQGRPAPAQRGPAPRRLAARDRPRGRRDHRRGPARGRRGAARALPRRRSPARTASTGRRRCSRARRPTSPAAGGSCTSAATACTG